MQGGAARFGFLTAFALLLGLRGRYGNSSEMGYSAVDEDHLRIDSRPMAVEADIVM